MKISAYPVLKMRNCKMEWLLKSVEVHTKSGPETHKMLTLHDRLGLFVDVNSKIAVTHVASGRRVLEPFDPTDLTRAVEFAENISPLVDWTSEDPIIPDITKDKLLDFRYQK
jgi:hypothetical protein